MFRLWRCLYSEDANKDVGTLYCVELHQLHWLKYTKVQSLWLYHQSPSVKKSEQFLPTICFCRLSEQYIKHPRPASAECGRIVAQHNVKSSCWSSNSITCSCQDALWLRVREEEELFVSDQVERAFPVVGYS